ncbi:MAG TPA: GNAT family N-acetyltransferase [Polyangiaceae bacterium]|nr:GNAT family N-acetyltransferase [Polyangiaceae bacterium]
MNATVEPARAADLPALARLLGAQFAEHSIELEPAALREALRGLVEAPARGAVLVARDEGGRAVGIACLSYLWTLEHGGLSAWLDELYVTPACRGRGLGARLVREACARAAADGCAAVDLEVEADHARVERLYAREGFRAHRRARWVKPLRG